MKKEVCINGRLLFPLVKGKIAMIARPGGYTRTAPVVKIREENAEYAHFETEDTVYRVSTKPLATRATLPSVLLMCA